MLVDPLAIVDATMLLKTDDFALGGFSGISDIVRDSFGSIDKLYEQGREVTGLATHYIEFDR
jgi:replicative DNA helicase